MPIDCKKISCLKVWKKILKTKNAWSRFYLSLPGRIAIAKTLMIYQLLFHCSILRPPDDWTKNIQKTIDEFCTSGLNIGKDRYYRETKVGGLGLINIEDFIASLHCAWFKRIEQSVNDNWKIKIYKKCTGEYNDLNSRTILDCSKPLIDIITSYKKFIGHHSAVGKNITYANIVENVAVQIKNNGSKSTVTEKFFDEREWSNFGGLLDKLKLGDLI